MPTTDVLPFRSRWSLALVLAASLAADEARGDVRVTAVTEADGSRLAVRDGRLFRLRRGEERELRPAGGGTLGHVRSLAASPCGLVFVAAADGLHVAHRSSPWTDRVELGPGAPGGAPRSLVVDERRRLWLATEEGFGPVDPVTFDGRVLRELEGRALRGPCDVSRGPRGPRGSRGSGGELVVHVGGESLTYRPDRGPPPRVTRVVAGGRDVLGGRLTVAAGGSAVLEVEGDARGGARTCWQLDDDHVWTWSEGAIELDGLRPGRHRLRVAVVDRDLRRSPTARVEVRVENPFWVEPPFAAGAIAIGGALVLAAFLARAVRARDRGAGPLRPGRVALSTGLAVVFGLQLLAGLFPHTRGWPFVGFGMYTRSRAGGEAVYEAAVIVLGPGGRARRVGATHQWKSLRDLIEGGEAAARSFLERYSAEHPDARAEGVQVVALRTRLTRLGPRRVAPLVHAHWREPEAGDAP